MSSSTPTPPRSVQPSGASSAFLLVAVAIPLFGLVVRLVVDPPPDTKAEREVSGRRDRPRDIPGANPKRMLLQEPR